MISIIVPVYNAENYIEDCINSILSQSYRDWELLLIDNGSKDNSLELCQRMAGGEERICVFSQEVNGGVSAARNLGMAKATGEWITFIDADDWVQPDFLERLFEIQEKNQADMVVCSYRRSYPKDREAYRQTAVQEIAAGKEGRQKKDYPSMPEKEYGWREYLENYLLAGNSHCWGVLYRKKLLQGIEFLLNLSIGEDLLFLIDAALKAEKITVTDYPGYYYYINTQGAMEKPFTPSYMDQITCWQEALGKLTKVYPKLTHRVESHLLTAVLLVVGKLARLPKEERRKYVRQQEYCLTLAREYSKKREVISYLPSGYPLKVRVYCFFPRIYLWVYGRWKKVK